MKLVKLTNASVGRDGDLIYINPSIIVSVYEEGLTGGSLLTKVYGAETVWTVEESLTDTVKLIEDALNA